jgi:hypothetical protein
MKTQRDEVRESAPQMIRRLAREGRKENVTSEVAKKWKGVARCLCKVDRSPKVKNGLGGRKFDPDLSSSSPYNLAGFANE